MFARATNLEIPKREVLDLYNKVRGPIETSSYGQSTQNKRTNKTKYYKRKGNKQVRRKTT